MIGLIKILVISVPVILIFLAGNTPAFAMAKPSDADGNHPFTPDERHIVTVGNLHVTYIESGTGRPVVLLHGNAGGVEDFEYGAVEDLAREYRVIAIDRPGHGESDRPDGEAGSVEY